MASTASLAAQKRRRLPAQAKNAQQHHGIRKATRRSARILAIEEGPKLQAEKRARIPTKQENLQDPQQLQKLVGEKRKRPPDPKYNTSNKRPRKRLHSRNPPQTRSHEQAEKRKRPREDEVPPSLASPEPSPKRVRTSAAPTRKTISEARIEYWSENGTWPTDEQETTMDRFRELVNDARARKRSLSRKRSNASLSSETTPTQIAGSLSRDQKCAPYKHPLFERQLKDNGSFMDEHELSITAKSENLCQQLLNRPQPVPQHTLFSDDGLFKRTCRRMKGENEAKIVDTISRHIFPSAEILADKGAKHLAILRETINACWVNSEPFIYPPGSGSGSRSGPRPQPDFGLGFDRDAFNAEQLQKLQPFLGDVLADYSLFAVTYQMYFPCLTCEVKCGDGGLDVADRQNAYTQSIILRGLHTLFQLVGREKELHREINGFSISHNDEDVRIWGHYAVIDGKDVRFYRHLISKFVFAPSGEGDQRWKAYRFVKNVYDLWLPKHFGRICSAIDMLPADLNFEVFDLPKPQASDPDLDSSRSGLSQQLEGYSLVDERVTPNSQTTVQQVTPDTTVQTEQGISRKKKKKP